MATEASIRAAIYDYNNGVFESMRQTARFHGVPQSTLSRRLRGQQCRGANNTSMQYLHPIQEGVVVSWIKDLRRQYIGVNTAMVIDLAHNIGNKPRPPGRAWLRGFYKRYSELKNGRGRVLPSSRLISIDSDIVRMVFDEIERLQRQFGIEKDDIYNMDEVGFQMGQRSDGNIVYDRYSGPPLVPRSDSTQWTSVIEVISCAGIALAPYIIHTGKEPSVDWFPPSNMHRKFSEWHWAFSPKGWSGNDLAVEWLEKSFIPQANKRRKGRTILLILDSHDSHCTGAFIAKCHDADIKLVWLPPHSSHLLQPLDLGPFAQLKREYSRQIAKYTPTGLASISRRQFAMLYYATRQVAMQERYIMAGWKLAGIEPRNIQRILENPIIKAIERTTPDLTLPEREIWSSPTQTLLDTPTQDTARPQERMSIEEIRSFIHEGQVHASPRSARAFRYIGRHLLELDATIQRVGSDFKLLYGNRTLEARANRKKKYLMDQEQRTYAFSDVIARREEAGEYEAIDLDLEG